MGSDMSAGRIRVAATSPADKLSANADEPGTSRVVTAVRIRVVCLVFRLSQYDYCCVSGYDEKQNKQTVLAGRREVEVGVGGAIGGGVGGKGSVDINK